MKLYGRIPNFQSINPFSSVCSARLRAVASGSLWTLTCAHMCVSTPGTARMCAPLTAAAKNLHSRPTWSLTSSHTQKQKTTNERAPGAPDRSSSSTGVHWRTWSTSLLFSKRWDRSLSFLHQRCQQRHYIFSSFLIQFSWRFGQWTCENPWASQAFHPSVALLGWIYSLFLWRCFNSRIHI